MTYVKHKTQMFSSIFVNVNCCGLDNTNVNMNLSDAKMIAESEYRKTELTSPSTYLDAISEDYSA